MKRYIDYILLRISDMDWKKQLICVILYNVSLMAIGAMIVL